MEQKQNQINKKIAHAKQRESELNATVNIYMYVCNMYILDIKMQYELQLNDEC